MINILQVVGKMNRGGAETFLMNIFRGINKKKYKFYFVVFDKNKGDFDDEILSLGGEIIYIKGKNSIARFFHLLYFLLKSKNKFSIIHSHLLFNDAFHLLAAKLCNIKTRISHSHSSLYKVKESFFDKFYKFFMRFLISRTATVRLACGLHAGKYLFGEKKFNVFNNAVDLSVFSKIKEKNANSWDEFIQESNILKIIQVGRLTALKNHLFSISVANELKQRNIDFLFVIAGQGEDELIIRNEIEKYQLSNNIRLVGVRTDIPELMSGADILLLPSYYEGFPVVLVESQSIGLYSIISDFISKEVDFGLNLISFQPIDSEKRWADCIQNYKSKINKFDMSKNLKTLKSKGFDLQENILKIEELYDK